MSLFDFFFPEEAQAAHLRRLADSQARSNTHNRIANARAQASAATTQRRIEELENELGQMTILVESLLECIEEQGLLSRKQLAQKIGEIDARDGVIDGRITKVPEQKKPFQAKLHIPPS